jgi:hypothetical protein
MTDPLAHILSTAPDLDDATDEALPPPGADRGYGKRSAYRSGKHPNSSRQADKRHPWRPRGKGNPPAPDTEPGRLVLTAADLEARKAAEVAAPAVDWLARLPLPKKPPGK